MPLIAAPLLRARGFDMPALVTYSGAAPSFLGSLLVKELDPDFSRASRTLLAGDGADRVIALGTVMAAIAFAAPVAAAVGGNTGAGTIGGVALGRDTLIGVYRITCIAEAVNGGTFSVVAPNGVRLSDAVVGTEYVSTHLEFEIQDSGEDFDIGDAFTVTVTAGSGKLVPLDPAGTDGTQIATSVAMHAATAPEDTDVEIVVFARDVILKSGGLGWPVGITENQRNAALADLAAHGIRAIVEG